MIRVLVRCVVVVVVVLCFFFFNDTATTEIYTLSLHDALPISSTRDSSLKLSPIYSSSLPIGKPSELIDR